MKWKPIETLPLCGLFVFGRLGSLHVELGWVDSRRPYGIATERGDIWFKPTHWIDQSDLTSELCQKAEAMR